MNDGSSAAAAGFRAGELYSNDEIYRGLAVGNAGGIRIHKGSDGGVRRAVLMTSSPTARIAAENPYHDRLEGDVLVYTAAGREGDQALGGMNQRLLEQLERPFPIYCFQQVTGRRDDTHGPRRWRFLGIARYLRHWKERQVDTSNQWRAAWVFEFRILNGFDRIVPDFDIEATAGLLAEDGARNPESEEERDFERLDPVGPACGEQCDPAETERLRRKMLCLEPEGFERLVGAALVAAGFREVEVTRRSNDGGIDVDAKAGVAMWPLRDLRVQLQAKRWVHTVGRREVAELRGSLQAEARGALVTTSQFSKAALQEASEPGKRRIVLVDGFEFARIVSVAKMDFG